jgi:hypothetical protein
MATTEVPGAGMVREMLAVRIMEECPWVEWSVSESPDIRLEVLERLERCGKELGGDSESCSRRGARTLPDEYRAEIILSPPEPFIGGGYVISEIPLIAELA